LFDPPETLRELAVYLSAVGYTYTFGVVLSHVKINLVLMFYKL